MLNSVWNSEVGYRNLDLREPVVVNHDNFCVRCGWNINEADLCGCDLMP